MSVIAILKKLLYCCFTKPTTNFDVYLAVLPNPGPVRAALIAYTRDRNCNALRKTAWIPPHRKALTMYMAASLHPRSIVLERCCKGCRSTPSTPWGIRRRGCDVTSHLRYIEGQELTLWTTSSQTEDEAFLYAAFFWGVSWEGGCLKLMKHIAVFLVYLGNPFSASTLTTFFLFSKLKPIGSKTLLSYCKPSSKPKYFGFFTVSHYCRQDCCPAKEFQCGNGALLELGTPTRVALLMPHAACTT